MSSRILFDVRLALDLVRSALRLRLSHRVSRDVAEVGRGTGGGRRGPADRVADAARAVRFAMRSLARTPGFTATVVLTLALGIGLSTSMFSVLNAVLLRPLEYNEPDRLVHVGSRLSGVDDVLIAGGVLERISQRSRVFEGVAGIATIRQNMTGTELPRQVDVGWSTSNLFDLLGVRAVLGRAYRDGDPMGTAVLSDESWRRDFGGDPRVVGRSIRLDGSLYTILGVLPGGFVPHIARVPRRIDIWKVPDPWWQNGDVWRGDNTNVGVLRMIGRLRRGIGMDAVAADLDRVAASLREELPQYRADGLELAAKPLLAYVVDGTRSILMLLMAAVAALLLIVCANVTGLLLVRAEDREHDVAVRTALGSGGGRIVGHLLVESMVLALAGGGLGVIVGYAGTRLLPRFAPAEVPRLTSVTVDGTVLMFALVAALFCTFLFGMAPAIGLWRRGPRLVLGARRCTPVRVAVRTRQLLVVAQISASLVLIVCAGLLGSSVARLESVEPGYDRSDVITFAVSVPGQRYDRPVGANAFYEQLEERIEALPGVQSVAMVWPLPGGGRRWDGTFIGGQVREEDGALVRYELVSGGFFETMRVSLMEGLPFGSGDAKRAVIVSRSLADRAWPGQSALGRTLEAQPWGNDSIDFVVTGVAADVHFRTLRDPPTDVVYFDSRGYVWTDWEVNFVVRAAGASESLVPAIREQLASLDADVPLANVRTMSALLDEELAANRFTRIMFVMFAVASAFLAALGLYAVIAYVVRRRSHEFGIRMALGSDAATIRNLVLGQGLRLTAAGVVAGAVIAFWATGLLRGLLFGIEPTNAIVYALAAAGLAVIAMVASVIPAGRVVRLDPATVFRSD